MNRAIVTLLLALTGQSPEGQVSDGPSAAIVERVPLRPAQLLGAWRGTGDVAPASEPFDVAFSPGIRPGTVFAHFDFPGQDGQQARTLRQLGRVLTGRVRFVLADGREISLWLDAADGRRLLGTIVQRGRESAIQLSRLRQRP
jgi:hypothetical protein